MIFHTFYTVDRCVYHSWKLINEVIIVIVASENNMKLSAFDIHFEMDRLLGKNHYAKLF